MRPDNQLKHIHHPSQTLNFEQISKKILDEVKVLKGNKARETQHSRSILQDLRAVPDHQSLNAVCLSKITKIMPYMNSKDNAAFLNILNHKNWHHTQNNISIGSLMHKLQFIRFGNDDRFNLNAKKIITETLKKVANVIPHIEFNGQAIGSTLYGLQNLNNSEEVQTVLNALATKITRVTNFTAQNIGMALYGLQNMKNNEGVEAVLHALATKITQVTDFTAQEIGMALYGLQNLKNSEGVEDVLNAFAAKIPFATTKFKPQEIGNALYGLKNLHHSKGVEALLKALATKIPQVTDFTAQAIGMALYALQNLQNSAGVEAVLHALATQILQVNHLDAQAIGNALYGLRNLNDENLLNQILNAFKISLKNNDEKYNAQKIIFHNFRSLLLNKDLLDIKLDFIREIIRGTPITEIAYCLFVSDYLALTQLKENESTPWIKALIDHIENSDDKKLIQLRTAANLDNTDNIDNIDNIDLYIGFSGDAKQTLLARELMVKEDELTELINNNQEINESIYTEKNTDQNKNIDEKRPVDNTAVIEKKRQNIHSLHQKITEAQSISSLTLTCKDILSAKIYTFTQNIPEAALNQPSDLLILLPTRGTNPDVRIGYFIKKLDESLSQVKDWQKTQSVRVILGVNGSDASQVKATVQKIDAQLKEIKTNHQIIIERHGFEWKVEGNRSARKVLPFGTIRNHWFNKALPFISEYSRFISVDGDITLTTAVIDKVFSLNSNQFTSIGYQLPQKHQNDANQATIDAFKLHWQLQSKACDTNNNSLAYPAEPCFIVGPQGLNALKALHEQGTKIYGSTDCEGRFLTRNLLSQGGQFIPIDSADHSKVTLHNFARFSVKPIPINNRKDFITWLSSIAGQSQNMLNLDFFTRQLAFALSIPDSVVRNVTQPLYVPNLLKEGHSLKEIQDLLSILKKSEANMLPKEKEKSKYFLDLKKYIASTYGESIANTVLKNGIDWAATTVNFSIAKSMKLGKPKVLSHCPTTITSGLVSPFAERTTTSHQLASLHYENRENKMIRDRYAPLNTDSKRAPASNVSLEEKIPRKRARLALESTSPKPAPTEIAHHSITETPIYISETPIDQMDNIEKRVDQAIKQLPLVMKDILTLLEPTDFDQQGVMSQKEIDQLFKNYVIDFVGNAQVPPELITKNLIADALRDLMVAR